jgi:hypothetical protein
VRAEDAAHSADAARTEGDDPFAVPVASPRGATALVAVAVALALAAPVSGLAVVVGPLGMLVALVAHVKGHRLGMPAAVLVGVTTILGMTVTLYLR